MTIMIDEIIVYMLGGGTMFAFILLVFFFVLLMKTPAFTFFKASMSKNGLLFNPRQNRFAYFIPIKKQLGRLLKTKEGIYTANASDFYVESKSKVPIAVVYSNYGVTLSPKILKTAEMLGELGINNYDELMDFIDKNKEEKRDVSMKIGLPAKIDAINNKGEKKNVQG